MAVKRPPGDPGDDRPTGNAYALFVGINEYQTISDLNGCIIDINRMERFAKRFWDIDPRERQGKVEGDPIINLKILPTPFEDYDFLKICRLEDEQATKANIVRAFRAFLTQAKAGDSVWFHFSGHGAEAPSAEVFAKLENGKDQGLMCHDYAVDADGNYSNFLADKEIAILLDEVANGEGGTPHILVTLDCCHSGGGTRFDDGSKVRNVELPENAQIRPLESYLDGHFVRTDGTPDPDKLDLPAPPHVVLTACGNLELAKENDGGYFSKALVEALESVPGPGHISYSDLQIRTRAAVRRRNFRQTPQFAVLGGLRAYINFLQGFPFGNPDRYEIRFFNGRWVIGLGAVHGMPTTTEMQRMATSSGNPIRLEVFSFEDGESSEPVGEANITAVGPHYSFIEFTRADFSLDTTLFGVLNYLPADPEFVLVSGPEADAVQAFIENADAFSAIRNKNIHLLTSPNAGTPHGLKVKIQADRYRLMDLIKDEEIEKDYSLTNADEVLIDSIKIVNWRRLSQLENTDPNSTLGNIIDLKLEIGNGRQVLETVQEKESRFIAREDTRLIPLSPDERYYRINPIIELKEDRDEELFFYLFSLPSSYAINGEDERKRKEEGTIAFPQHPDWGLDGGQNRDYLCYKLVVTSEEFDFHQLLQDGIFTDRGDQRPRTNVTEGFKDWCVKTIRLEMVRAEVADDTPRSGGPDQGPGGNNDNSDTLPVPVMVEREKRLGFRKSHAFVIGVNQYPGLDASLHNAVSDAVEVAKRLKVLQGFDNVLLMTDVGKGQIQSLLNWLQLDEHDKTLSIPNETFPGDGETEYNSRVAWLRMEGELADGQAKNDLEQLILLTDEDKPGEKATTIYLEETRLRDIMPAQEPFLDENDSIVFYYAGHGFPGEVNDGPSGYLAPTDAEDKMAFRNDSLLPMEDIYDALRLGIPCKHTLLILDCCFAEKFRFANVTRGHQRPFLLPLYERRFNRYLGSNAWQVLTSAGPDQTAADSAAFANIRNHSPFAKTLIAALEGNADVPASGNRGKDPGDGIVTATEVFLYVRDEVLRISEQIALQHPNLFPMREHQEGEFIFLNPRIDQERFRFAEDPEKNPYKGLLPYEMEDAHLYFGRERVITALQQKFEQEQVVFVFGPSAAGKTSLVQAGLFPTLQGIDEVLTLRPHDLLSRNQQGTGKTEQQKSFEELLDLLASSRLTKRSYVLFFDQYEEIFSLAGPSRELVFERATALFTEALRNGQKIIFTLRSDFEWQVRNSELQDYWKKESLFRMPSMDLDELREAITGPAWWGYVRF